MAGCTAALLLAAASAPAQDAPSAAPDGPSPAASSAAQAAPAPEPAPAPAPAAPLADDEVGRIDGVLVIKLADFDRYLATSYGRLPSGQATIQQILSEQIIRAEAQAAGLAVDASAVQGAVDALEAQARQATGGRHGLSDSLAARVSPEQMREAVALHVLHERLVRASAGLPPDAPVAQEDLAAWLQARLDTAALSEAPLDAPQAATWSGGTISKAEVGARLRSVLPEEDLAGLLNEMLGIVLVQRRAAAVGIALTPAEATREILERDAALREMAGSGDVTYDRFIQVTQQISLEELLASERFGAEVLIRLLTERAWSEAGARHAWESNRALFAEAGVQAQDWEGARRGVWKELRQRTYRQLFTESRIERRF